MSVVNDVINRVAVRLIVLSIPVVICYALTFIK